MGPHLNGAPRCATDPRPDPAVSADSTQLAAVRVFRNLPLFAGLSDTETYDILRICGMETWLPGEVLFRQGDPGHSAVLIETGKIEIRLETPSGQPEVVARLGPGSVVGELGLIDPAPRSATAVAVEASSAYVLTGPRFDALRRELNPAAFKVIRSLTRTVCERLRSMNQRIEAELMGAEPPPITTGRFDKLDPEALHAPLPSRDPNADSGFIRKLVGRFWQNGETS